MSETVRRIRLYAYEGHNERKLEALRGIASTQHNRSMGPWESAHPRTLNDPRQRFPVVLYAAESLELVMLLGSMTREDGFEFLEGGPSV
jgi:hypothetical protein